MDITPINTGAVNSSSESKKQAQEILATTQPVSFDECLPVQNITDDVNAVDTNSDTVDSCGKQAYDKYRYKEKTVKTADERKSLRENEDMQEAVEEIEEDIIASVAEHLQVDKAEITDALSALDLSTIDLLNPKNLALAVKELTGAEEASQLLLDADFKQLLDEMNTLGKEFIQSTGVTLEELVAAQDDIALSPIEQNAVEDFLKNGMSAGDNNMSLQYAVGNAEESLDILNSENSNVTENVDEQTEDSNLQAVNSNAETLMQTNQKADASSDEEPIIIAEVGKTDENADAVDVEQGAMSSENGYDQDRAASKTGQEQQNTLQDADFAQHVTAVSSEQVQVISETQNAAGTPSYMSVQTMDIIRQIVENVKVNFAAESTTMEMQLNPENLGKIYLNISSKEGNVHAQLFAQNEEVRAALEAQIATLTENLHQAGVKVEAVEVSVATHEFEKNLEQNAKGDEKQGERQEEKKSSRRNIRLDSLNELSGLMTEEETLIARMMKDNGNSVDYTA